ncbi:MAG: saccharopine dehydrogenase family protein [Planctomycetota bacterium]
MPKFRYAVLGAGRQGTAAAYDMARFGDAEQVVLADFDQDRAAEAARRVNELAGRDVARAAKVDVRDEASVVKTLTGINACLSAVPYTFNLALTKAAIQAGCHFCDLGGNTDIVLQQWGLDAEAKKKNVSVVPDCGLAPGLANVLAAYVKARLDTTDSIKMRCGGLPQRPKPPLGYKLVFNIAGLTNEYFGRALVIRNRKVQEVETFSELETLDFPDPVGRCEAFVTSGGTSTVPRSFEGEVEELDYKTVRYPGHFEKFKVLLDLGLLDLKAVEVDGMPVVPRKLFHRVAAPRIDFPDDKDLVVLRVEATGVKDKEPKTVRLDILDFHDDATGFTAMERTTGFPAAMIAEAMARGQVPAGVRPLESKALDHTSLVHGLADRGIQVTETVSRPLGPASK